MSGVPVWVWPLAAVVLVLLWVLRTRNRFVAEREHVRESWRTVDVELQRRHDLVANLVAVVRAHAAHERTTLEEVVRARAAAVQASDAHDVTAQAAEERHLAAGVRTLLAVSEAYPELRADSSFLDLQRHLVGCEDRIAAARRVYNSNVRIYERHRTQFPSMLVRMLFGFRAEPWFAAGDDARSVPAASF